MTHAFYDEFTNSEAVFDVIEQDIDDKEFINKMFHLLKFVYKYIKAEADAEELLRSHARSAIRCLNRIDRTNIDAVDRLIGAILHTDKELKLVREASVNFATLIRTFFFDFKENKIQLNRVTVSHWLQS